MSDILLYVDMLGRVFGEAASVAPAGDTGRVE
jgi:hypothetical protein